MSGVSKGSALRSLTVRAGGTGGPTSAPEFTVLVDGVEIGEAAIRSPVSPRRLRLSPVGPK
jgi:hypothetical protein